jgi:hypothetical protein
MGRRENKENEQRRREQGTGYTEQYVLSTSPSFQ